MFDWQQLYFEFGPQQRIDLLRGPIKLSEQWSPVIAPQRRSGVGGYDPQLDVTESMVVTIAADTRDQASMYLEELTYVLQVQATAFADGLAFLPVTLNARLKQSNRLITYLVLGQVEDNQQVVLTPATGAVEGKKGGYLYENIELSFLRRGSPILPSEDTYTINLIEPVRGMDPIQPWSLVTVPTRGTWSFGYDSERGIGTHLEPVLTVTLESVGSVAPYITYITSNPIGPVQSGSAYTLSLEAWSNLSGGTEVRAYLQDADDPKIINATTAPRVLLPIPPNSGIFPTARSSATLVAAQSSVNAHLVIEILTQAAGDAFSFSEAVLAQGFTAPYRESAAIPPEVQVLRFPDTTRFQGFTSLRIKEFRPADFLNVPQFLVLAAKTAQHISIVRAIALQRPPLATVIRDTPRLSYSGLGNPVPAEGDLVGISPYDVVSLVTNDVTTSRAMLTLADDVRRVKVFIVARAADASGAYRLRATLYSSMDTAYELPTITTEPHDYVALTNNPQIIYIGEAAFADRPPRSIRIVGERLAASDALYIDQVIVVAADDETTAELLITSIPDFRNSVPSSAIYDLVIRYNPQQDYRPLVALENQTTGETIGLSYRGAASLRSVGDQIAVAVVGCTAPNYILTSDTNNAPIPIEISASRYVRVTVPR